jgi:hypothetical protein
VISNRVFILLILLVSFNLILVEFEFRVKMIRREDHKRDKTIVTEFITSYLTVFTTRVFVHYKLALLFKARPLHTPRPLPPSCKIRKYMKTMTMSASTY